LSKHSEDRLLSCPSTETVVIVPEFKGLAVVGLMIYYGRSKKVSISVEKVPTVMLK